MISVMDGHFYSGPDLLSLAELTLTYSFLDIILYEENLKYFREKSSQRISDCSSDIVIKQYELIFESLISKNELNLCD